MTRLLLPSLLLSFVFMSVGPIHASTARAEAYLAKRNASHISSLTLTKARRTPGQHGKIVEWSGTVQGIAMSGDGLFLFMRLSDGQTIPVRGTSTGSVALGTKVKVLGRVVERTGLIHHIHPLAIAPASEVRVALAAARKRAAIAQRRTEEARKASSGPAVVAANPDAAYMKMDPRVLASRAGSLSLRSATTWIKSFNRGLDDDSASTLARTILYYCGSYGVDSRLALSLFAAESCFRQNATSVAGAMGIGQLMPGTADMLGVRDPYDPVQNAEGSIRHMRQLLSRWKGSPSQYQLTLASYNAGAGAVEKYGGIPPYPETINYVKIILGYYGELSQYH